MEYFISLFVTGLTKGSIYALIALGYTMVYGIIELINFAHGEIYMIGAFISLIVAVILTSYGFTGWPLLFLATAAAIVYASMYGWTVEKIAYKPLRSASRLAPLISAIGMSTFLQNYVKLTQTADVQRYPDLVPDFPLWLEPVTNLVGKNQLVIIVATFSIMIILSLLIKNTKVGLAMRATAQDKTMALLSGVSVNHIIASTFIIGSSLAAIGGVLIGAYGGSIKFTIGFLAGMKAFTAAVLGGIGNIPGAVLGALILGMAESFTAGYFSSDYEEVVTFGILILILIIKPSGILGRAQTQKV